MNPAKLKVVELRAELSSRGLDTKGNKAVLVERLQEALDQEKGADDDKQEEEVSSEEQSNQGPAETIEQEHETESEAQRDPAEASPSEPEPSPEPEREPEPESSPEPAPVEEEEEDEEPPRSETPEPEKKQPSPQKVPTPQATPPKTPKKTPQKTPQKSAEEEAEQMEVEERQSKSEQYDPADTDEPDDDEQMEAEEKTDLAVGVKKEQEDTEYTKHLNKAENGHKEGFENDIKPDIKNEADIKTEPGDAHVKSESRDYESRDRKRKRSASPRGRSERKFNEWEPEIKEDAVTLSWYDSDLNLSIEDAFFEATPFSDGGFGYVWAGIRGTHGYTSGSVCYQVKVVNYLDVTHLEDEPNPNLIRVGWSAFSTSLQLGEEPFSYGYGGTGKFSVDCRFSNYGKPFELNDVVTCYLQFTDDEAIMSFGVNDEYLGVAQRVPLGSLDGKALAPHILTKNAGFKVNFGQEETPWAEVKEGFEFVAKYPVENAVPGPRRPEKRGDCEMIMMCGLPACGKTVWASKYAAEHPEKNYNILGTNALIDRMKVMGLPRKANYHGRWDVLIEKCTKCLQRLMDIGCRRRRNYILDQTNVFPAAQRRKMRNFEGFTRKAVVIVPTDEEFKSRTEKQAHEEKKDVPESAVLEMKANFTLPDKNLFDEVKYVELQEEEAQALVEKYAKDAAEKGHFRKSGPGGGGPPAKRFRGGDFHHQKNDFRRDRFPSGPQSSSFRRGSDRGGPRGGGGGGSWGGSRGGSGSADRWRDRQGGGGYGRPPQGDRSGWRGPPSGPPGGSGRGPRDYDRGPPRSGGYDRNSRSGPPPRQGGGGYGGSRDYPRDNRGPSGGGGGMKSGGMGGKPRQVDKPVGQGNAAPAAQWNNQYQNQQAQAPAAGGQQAWGGQGQQAQWGQQQAQAWNNYQQQWKGYQQGYNQQQQQGYGQGYTPQQYNNWQQYYGNYQQQGWGQNSDGTFNYPQSWQNWYAAQNAGQANAAQAQQPPQAK